MENNSEYLKKHIVSTLGYFGLFKYPLSPVEIHRFLRLKCDLNSVNSLLIELSGNKEVFLSDEGFYTIENCPEWSVDRIRGNRSAEQILRGSYRFIKVVKSFPFVRSIAISGSLSKYYAGKDADIDYFIIAEKDRLWIARTLLHLFKKLSFITGHQHYYCMNYFIDESALEIDQKNIYSAIETVTLIPVYNKELISELKKVNTWVSDFLPNEPYKEDLRFVIKNGKERIKTMFEKMINLTGGNKLNIMLMKATDRKWRKKWKRKSYPMDKYDEAFYTTLNISKNHPDNYQTIVLNALKESETSLTP